VAGHVTTWPSSTVMLLSLGQCIFHGQRKGKGKGDITDIDSLGKKGKGDITDIDSLGKGR
jgi:hypothetical protein